MAANSNKSAYLSIGPAYDNASYSLTFCIYQPDILTCKVARALFIGGGSSTYRQDYKFFSFFSLFSVDKIFVKQINIIK